MPTRQLCGGQRTVIGAMTGTSLDGIDAAAARIEGRGYALRAVLLDHAHAPLGPLSEELRRAARGEPMTAADLASLALRLGVRYAEAIEPLARRHRPDLVAAHGQTIVHLPPVSWQLLNPAPIAQRLECPVVSDLRQADLARGGQGAPITPVADWVVFAHALGRRAVANLGGFCNVTILARCTRDGDAAPDALGFDVCACNHVLDEAARRALGAPFDRDGRSALLGRPDPAAVEALDGALERQRRAGRSLGTGDEASSWIAQHVARLAPADLAASAVEAVARCVSRAVAEHDVQEMLVAGGGARNQALLAALRRHVAAPVSTTDACGVAAEAREALAMAVLGALCADGAPITPPYEPAEPPGKGPPCGGSWTWPARIARDGRARQAPPQRGPVSAPAPSSSP
jgi:1,6-anhydro-N-acetylmuramate kinase